MTFEEKFNNLKTQEDIENYVNEKINSSKGGFIDSITKSKYDDFISPETECYASPIMCNPIHLDDKEMYVDFISEYKKTENVNISNVGQNILLVQNYIEEYFGSGRDEMKRRELNSSFLSGGGDHSIKEYKGKNVAVCFERSTVAHNLLHLLGSQSSLIMRGGHAYLLVKGKNSYVLYDPNNLTKVTNKTNNTIFYSPSLMILDDNTYNDLVYSDKQITFNDNFLSRIYKKDMYELEIPKLNYKGLELQKEKEENKEQYQEKEHNF